MAIHACSCFNGSRLVQTCEKKTDCSELAKLLNTDMQLSEHSTSIMSIHIQR